MSSRAHQGIGSVVRDRELGREIKELRFALTDCCLNSAALRTVATNCSNQGERHKVRERDVVLFVHTYVEPQMLLVPPRARLWKRGQSRRACSPLLPGGSQLSVSPVVAPRHSLLFLCLSLSFCCWFVFVFFGLFFLFLVFVLLGQQMTATVSWPSSFTAPSAVLCFLARFLCSFTLSQFNSLSLFGSFFFFFWLNLSLSPLSCCFYPSLSSRTCSCCW